MSPHLPEPDFQSIFDSLPGIYLILKPDFTMVAANQARYQATRTTPEGTLGRNLFDLFPDNPDDPAATGVANLKASLKRVLETKKPDTMAVQKYDIQRPESEGGGFEERYWSPMNSPVLDGKGEVAYIVHRVEDVTEFIRLKNKGAEQSKLAEELKGK
ncbi:MAG TPA: PAS domain-containing protein, partial [bacterium]|nr:PAS domain-containing protein [bacterium]